MIQIDYLRKIHTLLRLPSLFALIERIQEYEGYFLQAGSQTCLSKAYFVSIVRLFQLES